MIVGVKNEAGYAHQKYDVFRRAMTFWEQNAEKYTGFEVGFKLEPDADDPDLIIEYVDEIQECGIQVTTGSFLGCADTYTGETVEPPERVRLADSEDNEQLETVLRHELGHVLGIRHGEEPMPLMAESNLYAKASPWDRSNLTYYPDFSDKPGISESMLSDEVEPALEYFESGANGNLDPPVSFTRVNSASNANVVIEFHADPRGSDQFRGSTVEFEYEGTVSGTYYRTFSIGLYDLPTSRLSWHIGYVLWWGLGQGEPRPDVLDPHECDAHCRTGPWWR